MKRLNQFTSTIFILSLTMSCVQGQFQNTEHETTETSQPIGETPTRKLLKTKEQRKNFKTGHSVATAELGSIGPWLDPGVPTPWDPPTEPWTPPTPVEPPKVPTASPITPLVPVEPIAPIAPVDKKVTSISTRFDSPTIPDEKIRVIALNSDSLEHGLKPALSFGGEPETTFPVSETSILMPVDPQVPYELRLKKEKEKQKVIRSQTVFSTEAK